jgi:type II secretory pathway predicted ATPase ExeA
MYERFFGLRERPFDLTPNPRFLVMTEGHREALSNLEYAIAARKGITLLLGDAGCGKTTIIRSAIERQGTRVHCVHITNPALTRDEFVETLSTEFGLSSAARTSKAALLREFEELLRRRGAAGETTVLVFDEAQSLSNELLEEIRLLANIETADEKLVSLILAGQPELARQLDQVELRQLKQRVALRCELRPLTSAETLAYLAGRVRAAGGVASRIFTREAATLLHEYAAGIPRLINVLADNALLSAFGKQTTQVTSQLVADVACDFHIGVHAAGGGADAARTDTATAPPGDAAFQAEQPLLAMSRPADTPRETSIANEPPAAATEAPMFSSLPARRRFSFFGRRGTV